MATPTALEATIRLPIPLKSKRREKPTFMT
jgi:hypothetical protein